MKNQEHLGMLVLLRSKTILHNEQVQLIKTPLG